MGLASPHGASLHVRTPLGDRTHLLLPRVRPKAWEGGGRGARGAQSQRTPRPGVGVGHVLL